VPRHMSAAKDATATAAKAAVASSLLPVIAKLLVTGDGGLAHPAFSTTRIFDQRMRWMTRIAAPVLWAHVHDDRLRTLCLDLQCGVERVLGVCDGMMALSVQLETYGKLHLTTLHAALRLHPVGRISGA
jgi:hypothetical protein